MASYFVGDIQGCYQPLKKLLKQVKFDAEFDLLYPVGDLVARGDDSLAVAKLMLELGDAVKPVLGNHDLHLLAVYHGLRKNKKADKLDPLLSSDILPDYIHWLRYQPLVRKLKDDHQDIILVHAGWYPGWSLKNLIKCARQVETQLQADDYQHWLAQMYGNEPKAWQSDLSAAEQFRFTINACTRMRYLETDLSLELDAKMPLKQAPISLTPWFCEQTPEMRKHKIIFGHWASLLGETAQRNVLALDTGSVWGNQMTLYRLDDGAYFTA